MGCCCDDIGPPLMTCPRCKMSMAPTGRSAPLESLYCDCINTLLDRLLDGGDGGEYVVYAKSIGKRSSLWPGERWGDTLPCIGDPKCSGKKEAG